MRDGRGYMLKTIEAEAKSAASWLGRARLDPKVLAAIAEVPRHEFVPPSLAKSAYQNGPLPIGYQQTISQPFIVALMTDLLRPRPDYTILEVGTGSGYQAAVLSRLVRQVYSLEIIPELAEQARARLARLGYDNVEVIHGNGRQGLSRHAPYDGIIVTAAAEAVPQALIDQLKPGARLVIPVGGRMFGQELIVLERDEKGGVRREDVLPVAFVPLTGGAEHAENEED